jgi:hypothetical protein
MVTAMVNTSLKIENLTLPTMMQGSAKPTSASATFLNGGNVNFRRL